jgi:hypothetical protein
MACGCYVGFLSPSSSLLRSALWPDWFGFAAAVGFGGNWHLRVSSRNGLGWRFHR